MQVPVIAQDLVAHVDPDLAFKDEQLHPRITQSLRGPQHLHRGPGQGWVNPGHLGRAQFHPEDAVRIGDGSIHMFHPGLGKPLEDVLIADVAQPAGFVLGGIQPATGLHRFRPHIGAVRALRQLRPAAAGFMAEDPVFRGGNPNTVEINQ